MEPDDLPPKRSFAHHAMKTADLKKAEASDGIAKVKLIGATDMVVRASKEFHDIGHSTVAALNERNIKSSFSPLRLWMCVNAVHFVPHPSLDLDFKRRAFYRLHQSSPIESWTPMSVRR